MNRKFFIFSLILFFLLPNLYACNSASNGPEATLWGTWKFIDNQNRSNEYFFDLEFLEDGSLVLAGDDQNNEFVVIAPGRLKISKGEESEVVNYEIADDILTLYFESGTNQYKRIAQATAVAQLPTNTADPEGNTSTPAPLPTLSPATPTTSKPIESPISESFAFEVPAYEVDVYIEEDGTFSIWYLIDFQNMAGAAPIDYIDIRMPTSAYSLNNIEAKVNGQDISDIESSPYYVTNGFALGLGDNAIQPGQFVTVTVWITGVNNVLYPYEGSELENYVSFQFSPNYFGSEYDHSTSTKYRVTLILPPGVGIEESIHYYPENWPGSDEPEDIGRTAEGRRVYYSWYADDANVYTPYIFGGAFPETPEPEDTEEQVIDTGSSFTRDIDGMVMMVVPEGSFLMGSTNNDGSAYAHEKPQHEVYLDAFWMDAYEISNAMFLKFVESTGYQTLAEEQGYSYMYNSSSTWTAFDGVNWRHPMGADSTYQDSLPVTHVNKYDAQAYCAWVGGRLPTEAEWEKAARGDDGRIYPWGNSFDSARVHNNSSGGPISIYASTGGASPYGIYNLAGNVFEWTNDWYDANYYEYSPYDNPKGPAGGEWVAVRGGGWKSSNNYARASHRDISQPDAMNYVMGFRCVMDP